MLSVMQAWVAPRERGQVAPPVRARRIFLFICRVANRQAATERAFTRSDEVDVTWFLKTTTSARWGGRSTELGTFFSEEDCLPSTIWTSPANSSPNKFWRKPEQAIEMSGSWRVMLSRAGSDVPYNPASRMWGSPTT